MLLEAETEGELARLVLRQADEWVDVHREDLFGRLGRDLLDLDAALGRRHERDAPAVAVDDRAQVELALHREPLLDVQAPDLLPLVARLVRDELHAEDLLRRARAPLGAALGDLDASALAAAARVDLRFDDDDLALGLVSEALRGGFRLVDREGRIPLGDRHAVLREELLALVLVDFHVVASSASRVPRSGRDIGLGARAEGTLPPLDSPAEEPARST